MATIEINGKRVTVSDEFLKLSPEDQNKTVEEIAQSIGAMPAKNDNPTAAQQEAMQLGLPDPGPGGDGKKTEPYFGDTAIGMAADPAKATWENMKGIANPMASPLGQRVKAEGGYIPYVSEAGVSMGNAGLAALNGLGTVVNGVAGLAGDTIGLFGANENSQQQLANDVMGMVESTAGNTPMPTNIDAGAARAAARATRSEEIAASGAKAAKDLGIRPSLGMQGKTQAMIAAGLEKIPFAGDVIAKDAARAVGEVEGAMKMITGGQGTTPLMAGTAMQRGLTTFVSDFKAKSGKLYDALDAIIPQQARFPVNATEAAVAKLKEPFAGSSELAKKLKLNDWDAVLAEAQKNGVSWDALKQFRSEVGKAIGENRGALSDESLGRLKALYGGLTQDMAAAAEASGPKAKAAWSRADRFYRDGATKIERDIDSLIKPGKDGLPTVAADRAYSMFSGMAKDGASADAARIARLKSSMNKQDWNIVSGTIAEMMGKAKAGAQDAEGAAFSPGTFLTEWNKLSSEAKKALFDGQVGEELNKLAKVSEMVKSANAERNMSNTGTVNNLSRLIMGLWFAPKSTVAAVGGAYVAARGLTSKAMTDLYFLKSLNAAAAGDTKAMRALASGNGQFTADAKLVLQAIGAANDPNEPSGKIQKMGR